MNRKQKIIICVTGIFIVLLALVGLTYAYFLTQIKDNKNDKSISITTANLELVYADNSEEIIQGTGSLMPVVGTDVNDAIGTKTFTVTNKGDKTNYIVIIDNVSITKTSDGSTTTFVSNDFRYTLTCSVQDKDGNALSKEKCNDVNTLSIFPINGGMLVGNNIEEDRIHEYTLTLWYIDTGENQSDDMGKSYQARVNIKDITAENPFATGVEATDNASLAYNIVNNAKLNKNGTKLLNNPLTKPAEETSTYRTSKYNTIREYYPSWEEGGYDWEGLTYGPTQALANSPVEVEPPYIEEGTDPVEACNSVIGQYISDSYGCYYDGCDSIGKVVDCDENGIPTLEENEDYFSWEEGGYEWDDLTYGSTQASANGEPETFVEGIEPVDACNSVIGQYISDSYGWYYTGEAIGKVVACDDDGIPTLEENYYEYQQEIIETKNEKTLSVTPDDHGTSYYFRGDVKDNYVTFADMCWRIVRIAGDGSIKLILEDQYTTCDDNETETTSAVYTGNWNIGTGNYGYDSSSTSTSGSRLYKMNYFTPVTNKTLSMVKAFYDFQITKLADYTGKLKAGDWCLGDKAYTQSGSAGSYTYTLLEDTSSNYLSNTKFYYDAYTRLRSDNVNGYQPTLKCNGTILNEFADVSGVSSKAPMYVSAITLDEIEYAGGTGGSNYNYYLMNDYSKDSYEFWTLSPTYFGGTGGDYAYSVDDDGGFSFGTVIYNGIAFRPSVSLASSAVISSGEGTIENPYVIE